MGSARRRLTPKQHGTRTEPPSRRVRRVLKMSAMTEITRWRDPAVKPHPHGPLPPPVRTYHLSKTDALPRDAFGRALEEWLDDMTLASTTDGE